MSAYPTGRFIWYQLNASDPARAIEFYTGLVGWTTQDWERASGDPYTMFVRGDTPIGGVMQLPPEAQAAGAKQHWLSYICTPDVDACVMQARDHGATVQLPPTDLPEVGRFAVLADPQGIVFAAYTPATPPEDTPFAPQPGDVSWHELATTDFEQAFAFYNDLFDWEKIEDMDMGEAGIYRIFGRHDKALGGVFTRSAEMPTALGWMIYFRVPDLDAAIDSLGRLGGQVVNGPMEVPGGDQIAQCIDPMGTTFALHYSAD